MLPDGTYHVYNHANGKENLFSEQKNYSFFLNRLSQHLLPVSKLCAYCLMPNHFHLLVKIRPAKELNNFVIQDAIMKKKSLNTANSVVGSAIVFDEKQLVNKVIKSFSNFFNSYTQSYNKMYSRKGSLFIPNMKKEEVISDVSFRRVVYYIHNNPVHHKFLKSMDQWPHSSLRIFHSPLPTKLEREFVLAKFGGLDAFSHYHIQPPDTDDIWADC
jgi:putative transposase